MSSYTSLKTQLYKFPGQYEYDGMQLSSLYKKDVLDKVKTFELRPEDVFITAYPRSGKSWLAELCWLVLNEGDTEKAASEALHSRVPTVEVNDPAESKTTLQKLEEIPKGQPRIMNTFLQFYFYEKQIMSVRPKVIIMLRNPKDILVSYYHFYCKSLTTGFYSGSWDHFFDLFKAKHLMLGDWFEHTNGWCIPVEDDPNYCIVQFEDIREDPRGQILKVCNFLGKDFSDETIDKIEKYLSLEEMKKNPLVNMENQPGQFKTDVSPFLRSGTVAQWREFFSAEQNREFDALFNRRSGDIGIKFQFE